MGSACVIMMSHNSYLAPKQGIMQTVGKAVKT